MSASPNRPVADDALVIAGRRLARRDAALLLGTGLLTLGAVAALSWLLGGV